LIVSSINDRFGETHFALASIVRIQFAWCAEGSACSWPSISSEPSSMEAATRH